MPKKVEEIKELAKEEEENEQTEEQRFYKSNRKWDVIYTRVTNLVYRQVYKIAKENDVTMADVVRLSLETNLMQVDQLLKEIRELKNEYKNK